MANLVGSTASDNYVSHIYISSVTIGLKERFMGLKSVNLSINDKLNDVPWERNNQKTLQATFREPLGIVASHQLSFHLRHYYQIQSNSEKDQHIHVNASQLMHASLHTGDRREWQLTLNKVNVVIVLSLGPLQAPSSMNDGTSNLNSKPNNDSPSSREHELKPTTEDILGICPRFRILLVGKTGVGKSSLINKAFGVNNAKESHLNRGQADINPEILSDQNKRFILHDSLGLEPGEVDNLQIVRKFIADRNSRPSLKDKLHAVWLCLATPIAGGRIFEAGVETFLVSKKEGFLGDVPVIVVFTKYDRLVDRETMLLYNSPVDALGAEDIFKHGKEKAGVAFEKECVDHFEEVVGGHVPYVPVSTQPGYEGTLTDLIQLTFNEVERHVAKDPSMLVAMTQS